MTATATPTEDAPSLLRDTAPPPRRLLVRTRITVDERGEKGSPVRTQYELTGADGLPLATDDVVALLEGTGVTVKFVPRVCLVPGDTCAAPYCGCQRWRPVVRGKGTRPKCSCGHPATTAKAQKPGHLLVEE